MATSKEIIRRLKDIIVDIEYIEDGLDIENVVSELREIISTLESEEESQ